MDANPNLNLARNTLSLRLIEWIDLPVLMDHANKLLPDEDTPQQ